MSKRIIQSEKKKAKEVIISAPMVSKIRSYTDCFQYNKKANCPPKRWASQKKYKWEA